MKIRYRTQPRWGKPPLVVLQIEVTEWDHILGSSLTSWRDAVPEDLFPANLTVREYGFTELKKKDLSPQPEELK